MATAAAKTAGNKKPAQRATLKEDAVVEVEQLEVNVPKPFKLTRDDGTVIDYRAGVYKMPASDADHWWSQANGVTPH